MPSIERIKKLPQAIISQIVETVRVRTIGYNKKDVKRVSRIRSFSKSSEISDKDTRDHLNVMRNLVYIDHIRTVINPFNFVSKNPKEVEVLFEKIDKLTNLTPKQQKEMVFLDVHCKKLAKTR